MIYVSLNDNLSDPTYASLDDATLVYNPHRDSDDFNNPCTARSGTITAPVAPINHDEAERLASILGWKVSYQDNSLIFITNIPA